MITVYEYRTNIIGARGIWIFFDDENKERLMYTISGNKKLPRLERLKRWFLLNKEKLHFLNGQRENYREPDNIYSFEI